MPNTKLVHSSQGLRSLSAIPAERAIKNPTVQKLTLVAIDTTSRLRKNIQGEIKSQIPSAKLNQFTHSALVFICNSINKNIPQMQMMHILYQPSL
jgi:hypothetical protein